MKIAFTGHRPDTLGGYVRGNDTELAVKEAIRAKLQVFHEEHGKDLVIITGMSLGVDQWVAEVCLVLGIPYLAAIPCKGQDARWTTPAKALYRKLLDHARSIYQVCEGGFATWKLQCRNEWMVDNCDLLLVVWNGMPSGTANCVAYARKRCRAFERLSW